MADNVKRRAFLAGAAKLGAAGALLPTASALLAACGGGSSGSGRGGSTKITWSYWGSPEEN